MPSAPASLDRVSLVLEPPTTASAPRVFPLPKTTDLLCFFQGNLSGAKVFWAAEVTDTEVVQGVTMREAGWMLSEENFAFDKGWLAKFVHTQNCY